MLARADAGERPIERHRVFLDDIALDAADAARVIADRKGVRLEVEEFEESPVDGDAVLLRQLAIILLDNAIKFTSAGGAVTRERSARRPSEAALRVSDNGVGSIPPTCRTCSSGSTAAIPPGRATVVARQRVGGRRPRPRRSRDGSSKSMAARSRSSRSRARERACTVQFPPCRR